jgi:hypothetical protein
MKNVVMQNRITWVLVLGLLGLLIFGLVGVFESPEHKQARFERYRLESYERAVACSETKNPRVKFEDIDWIITPGNSLEFVAVDGTAVFAGWSNLADTSIYIPEQRQNQRWVLTHEVLHQLGYVGHPDHPFRTCRVMPDQN